MNIEYVDIKIALIGAGGIGKSSIINEFIGISKTASRITLPDYDRVIIFIDIKTTILMKNILLRVKYIIDDFHYPEKYPKDLYDKIQNYDGFIFAYSNDDQKSFNFMSKIIPVVYNIKGWNPGKNIMNKNRKLFPTSIIRTKNDCFNKNNNFNKTNYNPHSSISNIFNIKTKSISIINDENANDIISDISIIYYLNILDSKLKRTNTAPELDYDNGEAFIYDELKSFGKSKSESDIIQI